MNKYCMTTTGKVIVWGVVAVLVIWGIVSMSKKDGTESETIKIGFIGPLTGDTANIGQNAQAAVAIAVEEVNNSGGVLGKKVEVVYEDDGCNGATAANAVSKLINTDKVVAILGGTSSVMFHPICSKQTMRLNIWSEMAKQKWLY